MNLSIKKLLIELGRRLVLLNYVPGLTNQFRTLDEANAAYSKLAKSEHDLRYRVQELNKNLKTEKLQHSITRQKIADFLYKK